jgi:hypothetical protein
MKRFARLLTERLRQRRVPRSRSVSPGDGLAKQDIALTPRFCIEIGALGLRRNTPYAMFILIR